MAKEEPKRMCIACRQMQEKRSLSRVVKNADGAIFLDSTNKASGRGAYICSKPECIAKAKKQKLFNKAFSADVPPEIYDKIGEALFGNG